MDKNLETGFITFLITVALGLVVYLCRERPSFRTACAWIFEQIKTLAITIALFGIFILSLYCVGWIINLVIDVIHI